MMERSILALLACAALVPAGGAIAQDKTEPQAAPAANEARVPGLVIADRVVLRIRENAGGLSAAERAQSLRMRLGPILTMPDLKPSDVVVRQRRRFQTATILVRGRLLITVDRALAKANSSSPGTLASQWAANLKEMLPRINVAVAMVAP